MMPMNEFITTKLDAMKEFIDDISDTDDTKRTKKFNPHAAESPEVNMAKEHAHVFEIVLKTAEKMIEGAKPEHKKALTALLKEMGKIVLEVEQSDLQSTSKAMSYAKLKVVRDDDAHAMSKSKDDLSLSESEVRSRVRSMTLSSGPKDSSSSNKSRWSLSDTIKITSGSLKKGLVGTLRGGHGKSKSMTSAAGLFTKPSTAHQTDSPTESFDETLIMKATGSHPGDLESAVTPPKPVAKDEDKSKSVRVRQAMPEFRLPKSPTVSIGASKQSEQKTPLANLREAVSGEGVEGNRLKKGKPECQICGLPVDNETELIVAFGKWWHTVHFTCSVCSTSLTDDPGKQYSDGKLFCRTHATSSHIAAAKPIEATLAEKRNALKTTSKSSEVGRKVCSICRDPVADDELHTVVDKQYHKKCFKCNGCGTSLIDTEFKVHEGAPYCRDDYNARTGLTCAGCAELLKEGETQFEVLGRKYHKHCRRCDQCGDQLLDKEYFIHNDNVMCLEHRDQLKSCYQCKEYITSNTVLIALKKQVQYHPEHFKCSGCKKDLAEKQFFERKEQPWCSKCYFDRIIKESL
jgi:hypothetical protein